MHTIWMAIRYLHYWEGEFKDNTGDWQEEKHDHVKGQRRADMSTHTVCVTYTSIISRGSRGKELNKAKVAGMVRVHSCVQFSLMRRLAVVSRWSSNRCCEQCKRWVTPAPVCCSTSSPMHSHHILAFCLPQLGHLLAWPLSMVCPAPISLFFSTRFPHRG